METPAASRSTGRIEGYDFARALAILGMILVNFKLALGASDNGPTWLRWMNGLLEGRAAATFVILAGVGISLLSQKGRVTQDPQRLRDDRITLAKRAVFLFVFGLLYSPIWQADILHFYGLYLAISIVLLTVSDQWLWRWAAAFVAIAFVLLVTLEFDVGWDFDKFVYTDFWTVDGMIRHMFFNGFHPVFPWTAFLIVGMWLGRQDVRQPALQQFILKRAFFVAVLTEGLSTVLLHGLFAGDDDAGYVFGTQMVPPFPLYIIAASATALVVIILSIRLVQRFEGAQWVGSLVATGQLALTLYVAHVLIGMGLMAVFGWLEDGESLWLSVGYSFAFFGAGVVFSKWWREHFKRGPLEWVMRKVTA